MKNMLGVCRSINTVYMLLKLKLLIFLSNVLADSIFNWDLRDEILEPTHRIDMVPKIWNPKDGTQDLVHF